MLSDSRIETSSQTERKQACGLSMVDQKKNPGSGYVLEPKARSPLGIFFSSNDKQSLPSEEREESKEVQESKAKGIFFFSRWSNRRRLPSLLDRRSQRSRSSLIEP